MHRDVVLTAVSLILVWSSGCQSAPEEKTLGQLVEENTRILSQLGSYRSEEQQEGINRFLRLGKEQGSELAFYFLNDRAVVDARQQVVLARILSMWKDPRGVPFLLDGLSSQDSGVVRIAKEGLMVYGDYPRIIDALEETLRDHRVESRTAAAEILSKMKGPRPLQLLGERLKTEENAEVRAICLFGVIDGDNSRHRLVYLIDALTDSELEIRELAWTVLRQERKLPDVFRPGGDLARRAEAVSGLRLWAGASARAHK